MALVVPEVIAPALQPQASWLSVLHDGRLPAAIVVLAAARASRNAFVGLAAGVATYLSVAGV